MIVFLLVLYVTCSPSFYEEIQTCWDNNEIVCRSTCLIKCDLSECQEVLACQKCNTTLNTTVCENDIQIKEIFYCFGIEEYSNEVCSAKGKCVSQNECNCEEFYFGEDCSFFIAYLASYIWESYQHWLIFGIAGFIAFASIVLGLLICYYCFYYKRIDYVINNVMERVQKQREITEIYLFVYEVLLKIPFFLTKIFEENKDSISDDDSILKDSLIEKAEKWKKKIVSMEVHFFNKSCSMEDITAFLINIIRKIELLFEQIEIFQFSRDMIKREFENQIKKCCENVLNEEYSNLLDRFSIDEAIDSALNTGCPDCMSHLLTLKSFKGFKTLSVKNTFMLFHSSLKMNNIEKKIKESLKNVITCKTCTERIEQELHKNNILVFLYYLFQNEVISLKCNIHNEFLNAAKEFKDIFDHIFFECPSCNKDGEKLSCSLREKLVENYYIIGEKKNICLKIFDEEVERRKVNYSNPSYINELKIAVFGKKRKKKKKIQVVPDLNEDFHKLKVTSKKKMISLIDFHEVENNARRKFESRITNKLERIQKLCEEFINRLIEHIQNNEDSDVFYIANEYLSTLKENFHLVDTPSLLLVRFNEILETIIKREENNITKVVLPTLRVLHTICEICFFKQRRSGILINKEDKFSLDELVREFEQKFSVKNVFVEHEIKCIIENLKLLKDTTNISDELIKALKLTDFSTIVALLKKRIEQIPTATKILPLNLNSWYQTYFSLELEYQSLNYSRLTTKEGRKNRNNEIDCLIVDKLGKIALRAFNRHSTVLQALPKLLYGIDFKNMNKKKVKNEEKSDDVVDDESVTIKIEHPQEKTTEEIVITEKNDEINEKENDSEKIPLINVNEKSDEKDTTEESEKDEIFETGRKEKEKTIKFEVDKELMKQFSGEKEFLKDYVYKICASVFSTKTISELTPLRSVNSFQEKTLISNPEYLNKLVLSPEGNLLKERIVYYDREELPTEIEKFEKVRQRKKKSLKLKIPSKKKFLEDLSMSSLLFFSSKWNELQNYLRYCESELVLRMCIKTTSQICRTINQREINWKHLHDFISRKFKKNPELKQSVLSYIDFEVMNRKKFFIFEKFVNELICNIKFLELRISLHQTPLLHFLLQSENEEEEKIDMSKFYEGCIQEKEHLLIIGPGGSGKSCLVRHLCHYLLTHFDIFPIFVKCDSLIENVNTNWNSFSKEKKINLLTDVILSSSDNEINSNLTSPEIIELKIEIKEILKLKKIFLVIDGFDEVPDIKRNSFDVLLKEFLHEKGLKIKKIILSSRPFSDEFESLSLFKKYDLLPYSEKHSMKLVERILEDGEYEKKSILSRFVDTTLKIDIEGNPLIAVLILKRLLDSEKEDDKQIINKYHLYDLILNSSLNEDKKRRSFDRNSVANCSVSWLMNCFSIIAYVLHRLNNQKKSNLVKTLNPYLDPLIDNETWLKDIPNPIESIVDSLVKFSSFCSQQKEFILFTHRTIQEFYAARFIINPNKNKNMGVLLKEFNNNSRLYFSFFMDKRKNKKNKNGNSKISESIESTRYETVKKDKKNNWNFVLEFIKFSFYYPFEGLSYVIFFKEYCSFFLDSAYHYEKGNEGKCGFFNRNLKILFKLTKMLKSQIPSIEEEVSQKYEDFFKNKENEFVSFDPEKEFLLFSELKKHNYQLQRILNEVKKYLTFFDSLKKIHLYIIENLNSEKITMSQFREYLIRRLKRKVSELFENESNLYKYVDLLIRKAKQRKYSPKKDETLSKILENEIISKGGNDSQDDLNNFDEVLHLFNNLIKIAYYETKNQVQKDFEDLYYKKMKKMVKVVSSYSKIDIFNFFLDTLFFNNFDFEKTRSFFKKTLPIKFEYSTHYYNLKKGILSVNGLAYIFSFDAEKHKIRYCCYYKEEGKLKYYDIDNFGAKAKEAGSDDVKNKKFIFSENTLLILDENNVNVISEVKPGDVQTLSFNSFGINQKDIFEDKVYYSKEKNVVLGICKYPNDSSKSLVSVLFQENNPEVMTLSTSPKNLFYHSSGDVILFVEEYFLITVSMRIKDNEITLKPKQSYNHKNLILDLYQTNNDHVVIFMDNLNNFVTFDLVDNSILYNFVVSNHHMKSNFEFFFGKSEAKKTVFLKYFHLGKSKTFIDEMDIKEISGNSSSNNGTKIRREEEQKSVFFGLDLFEKSVHNRGYFFIEAYTSNFVLLRKSLYRNSLSETKEYEEENSGDKTKALVAKIDELIDVMKERMSNEMNQRQRERNNEMSLRKIEFQSDLFGRLVSYKNENEEEFIDSESRLILEDDKNNKEENNKKDGSGNENIVLAGEYHFFVRKDNLEYIKNEVFVHKRKLQTLLQQNSNFGFLHQTGKKEVTESPFPSQISSSSSSPSFTLNNDDSTSTLPKSPFDEEEEESEEKGIFAGSEAFAVTSEGIILGNRMYLVNGEKEKKGRDRLIFHDISICFMDSEKILRKCLFFGESFRGLPNGMGVVFHPISKRMIYEGAFRNGVFEGEGTLYDFEKEQKRMIYRGEFRKGLFEGKGQLFDCDTGVNYYMGGFRRGQKDGKGSLFSKVTGNLLFDGYFERDKLWKGMCEIFNEMGESVYRGEIREGEKHFGRGVVETESGERYKTVFIRGGIQNKDDKSIFNFIDKRDTIKIKFSKKPTKINEKLNGEEYDKNSNVIYSGTFVKGYYTGKGKIYNGKVCVYSGELYNDLPNGTGEQFDKRGFLLFSGVFEKGKIFKGLKYVSGRKVYKGQFNSQEQFHGNGMEFAENHVITFQGKFVNGKRKNGTERSEKTGEDVFVGDFNEDGEYRHGTLFYYEERKKYKFVGSLSGNGKDGFKLKSGDLWLRKRQSNDCKEYIQLYSGFFSNNKYHGSGKLYEENSSNVLEGTFLDGKFVKPEEKPKISRKDYRLKRDDSADNMFFGSSYGKKQKYFKKKKFRKHR